MAADAQGNDLSKVNIPVTGFLAIQKEGTPTYVDSAEGAKNPLTLPTGYVKLGLVTDDGGPEPGKDGEDAIEFWQEGYSIGGSSTRTVKVTLAENNDLTRWLLEGVAPDANGMTTVGGGNDATFPLFYAVQYKNGRQERYNGLAKVSEISESKSERGAITGYECTFTWVNDETVGGAYRHWTMNAATSQPAQSPARSTSQPAPKSTSA